MLDVGDDAPEFELPNQRGETVRLSDFEGRRVVVYFYPRANTDGCTIEARGFRDEMETFDRMNVVVLGVSDDPVDDLAAFAAEQELNFDLLSDEGGEVATIYESYGEKQLFGNTFDGVFRNTYLVGTNGRIEAAYEGVSPRGHAMEVFADIEPSRAASCDD